MEMHLRRSQSLATSRPCSSRSLPSVQPLMFTHHAASTSRCHQADPCPSSSGGGASTSGRVHPGRPTRISSSNGNGHSTKPHSSEDAPLPGFDSIADAVADVAAGKFVVVLDDEDRENEGDLIMAASRVTTADMAFIVEHSSGVVCIGMEGADLDRLQLPLMVTSAENDESMYTAFTVTVDAREGTTTGISAADRAATVRLLADPQARPAQFRRPGHIFPLRYRPGGVLVRPGHTEAAVDLSRLAGCGPAGVLCELVDRRDGSMSRAPQLREFALQHKLRIITIVDLKRYLLRHGPQAAAAPERQHAAAV